MFLVPMRLAISKVCLIMTVGKIELSAILKYKLFVSSVYKVVAVISNGSNKDICIEKYSN